MREVIRHRLAAATVDEKAAFDSPQTMDYLCRESGGHPRNLMILVRSTCDQLDDLPLTRAAAELSVREMSNAFERALNRPEYFEVLRKVAASHELPGSEFDQVLLYNLSVLEYQNGEVTYAVNPAVKLLSKFSPPAAAKKPKPRRRR